MTKPVPAIAIAATLLFCVSPAAMAANSFVIESKSFEANTPACTVGVYLTNDLWIAGVVAAIEMRTVSGGAYIGGTINPSTFTWGAVPGGRLDNSPLGPAGENWPDAILITDIYPAPDSGVCQDVTGIGNTTYSVRGSLPNAVSPDGFLHAAVSTGDPGIGEDVELEPGTDPSGAPSLWFIFPVGSNVGTFKIDSCCVAPANVCSYVDITTALHYVEVTRGIITVTPCQCDCFADPVCDGIRVNLPDVVTTIDIAFRGKPEEADPSPSCLHVKSDVDCSGLTDIVDVVKMISVAFAAEPATTVFCNPCP